jgi:dipeptidase
MPGDNCTSILVGRKATTDGSVITSHTCDSWYRTWMRWVPAADIERDTVMDIYEGRMHTEYPGSMDGVKVKGQIPQPAGHTYRYLDTAYPCLNEHQLGIGETTFTGRDTLENKDGMFMIEELCRVALQRCTKARDAILLMGQLIHEYGYGDSGECLTIADTEEAWIFEALGEGPDQVGGVWAAQRIPDDEVCVSANISRIGSLSTLTPPTKPAKAKKGKKPAYAPLVSDTQMASQNVFDVARKLGFWDGSSEFSFWRAYSGVNYFDEEKNYSTRELYIMQQLAPSLGLNDTMDELPVSIRPDSLVSYQKVISLLGTWYEGDKQLDLTQKMRIPNESRDLAGKKPWASEDSIISSIANPWMNSRLINTLYALTGDNDWHWVRTVAVPQCAYSTVIQLRGWLPDAVGGVCWMSLDNPGQSPRFPIFCGTTQLPRMLEVCGQHRYRDDALVWHYRQANKLATVRWGECRKDIESARQYFLDKAERELPFVEQQYQSQGEAYATDFLNGYTADFVGATVLRWDELYRQYWRKFWSGF